MENLIFSLNATMPVFLMMVLGMVLRRIGWIDEKAADWVNRFVFRLPLPVLLFEDIISVDIRRAWDTRFVAFCAAVTCLSIAVAWALSRLWRERSVRGEFIQASYRSSAALLGTAFLQNIYGTSAMAPLMMLGSVPLYNIMAVAVLTVTAGGGGRLDRRTVGRTLRGIVTNPLILAIAAGIAWSLLRLPMPAILGKAVSSVGGIATPLGLMAMGAVFDGKKALGCIKPSLTAAFMKLIGFCALFLPLAVLMGFREQQLTAILVMLGSATTISSFTMARGMGHDGTLSAAVVMLTTLFSAVTVTGWIWLLRSLQVI